MPPIKADNSFQERWFIDGEPLLTTRELAQTTGLKAADLDDAAGVGLVPSIKFGFQRYFLLSAFKKAVEAHVRGPYAAPREATDDQATDG